MFQKITWIVFILCSVLMVGSIIFASNPFAESLDYLANPQDFHLMYFQQTMLLVQIFNSIMSTTLVIVMIHHSLSYDKIFISYIRREKICGVKFLLVFLILFYICFFEMIVVMGVGMIRFSKWILTPQEILSFFYLFLVLMFDTMVNMVLSSLANTIFIPMGVLMVQVIIKVLCNNSSLFLNTLGGFIPILNYQSQETILRLSHPVLSGVWILLLFCLFYSIYNIKDLK